MSSRHGSSRRQVYGRRMKDLRSRDSVDFEIDLEGPTEWSRGRGWEADSAIRRGGPDQNHPSSSARAS